ncbi:MULTISPECIES: alpha-L-fucosidase [unclassified Actinomyces]|uniref:alpha-L-fucosidase n=1 Tax=unclassified Actinomyces TaxID=2609248 RepID=UPI0020177F06|nr:MULTISPECIES: alpha-L-fucosidase [unclassified Actinomyces]MCL3778021.1 alpha-L-fucosidase [Actinomyces sp. AC-20-1]MCL3789984.1 alpha-L-fucosidase [Actinomyces sp. 187325]MCL3791538.1 alpha-L-fucosidase [Actinomyces sp. 186855]MCL3793809.1 alpha-L-fucosidase [Actinomyces sp. 217892]
MTDPNAPRRPALYERFERPVPQWFLDSGLGIFIHWGAYSVPAWAEPIGALGTFDLSYWFEHNPYAEWYLNTIRIEGSPAAEHHLRVHGSRPYDDFLDEWSASAFDPEDWAALFARAGARYVVPTTKHHDGITLWDAVGTQGRNTVVRGPHRDLVGEIARAVRGAGMRFGTYYSTGIDWHAAPTPPITDGDGFDRLPHDEVYARYVHAHLTDLIERYRPEVLWADIDYPRAGRQEDSDFSLVRVLERFYDLVPEGVVNDRWGGTHWDLRTSEYEQGTEVQQDGFWQHTRGIGYSFGYNQLEDDSACMSAHEAVRELVDVVSRGGNLLLNVGPDEAGRIPEPQRRCLEGMAQWMTVGSEVVHGARRAEGTAACGGGADDDGPWVRWIEGSGVLYAAVDDDGEVVLPATERVRAALGSGGPVLLETGGAGAPVEAGLVDGGLRVVFPVRRLPGPHVLRLG